MIDRLRQYSEEQHERFMGVAMPENVANRCPQLCSRLWHELDIVPIAFPDGIPLFSSSAANKDGKTKKTPKSMDELAEAMSRRCVR